jgi:hypothetical protein
LEIADFRCSEEEYALVLHAVFFPLYYYRQKHQINLVLLGLASVVISFTTIGIICVFTSGKPQLIPRFFFQKKKPFLKSLVHTSRRASCVAVHRRLA